MKKIILSLILLLSMFGLILCGCREEEVVSDNPIISDGSFKIGVLLPQNESTTELTESGISFANNLADSVILDESIVVSYITEYYTNNNDVATASEKLINNGVSAIIYNGQDYNAFVSFTEFMKNKLLPVISLSPYTSDNDNIFTLSLSVEYMSSCIATYAMEKGYSTTAVLFEDDNDYSTSFADVYKSTFMSYVGNEPTVYYKNGELSNYSASLLSAGNYECLFMVSSDASRESILTELRTSGYSGEIIFAETNKHSDLKNSAYNNCSFISKVHSDDTNNVATVFYSMYSEQNDARIEDVEPAVAYGYDAYMLTFEALKSFGSKTENSIFSNVTSTENTDAINAKDIKSSEYIEALSQINYLGVTDTITFTENRSIPSYIYVDNIINGQIIYGNKYSFTKNIN